jgi:uncharacterized protein YdhG (YjbR/CyaY superfamily)
MDDAVRSYVDAIPAGHRELFDRVHRLVLEAHPDAGLRLSYRMPTFRVGKRNLHVGVWQHGVSLYGWGSGHDAGFTERHPELLAGRGTIRLRPDDAERITDDELRDLARAALDG